MSLSTEEKKSRIESKMNFEGLPFNVLQKCITVHLRAWDISKLMSLNRRCFYTFIHDDAWFHQKQRLCDAIHCMDLVFEKYANKVLFRDCNGLVFFSNISKHRRKNLRTMQSEPKEHLLSFPVTALGTPLQNVWPKLVH